MTVELQGAHQFVAAYLERACVPMPVERAAIAQVAAAALSSKTLQGHRVSGLHSMGHKAQSVQHSRRQASSYPTQRKQ